MRGGAIVGYSKNSTGIWVIVKQKDGKKIVKILQDVVSASDKISKDIHAILEKRNNIGNIRPAGNYSAKAQKPKSY